MHVYCKSDPFHWLAKVRSVQLLLLFVAARSGPVCMHWGSFNLFYFTSEEHALILSLTGWVHHSHSPNRPPFVMYCNPLLFRQHTIFGAAKFCQFGMEKFLVKWGIQTMGSIHLYFARKQVGDTPKRGKPEMRSSCRNSLDLHWSAAGLQVSPTSDTSQSVAHLPELKFRYKMLPLKLPK